MRKWIWLILLLSCKAPQSTVMRQAATVRNYTVAQLTVIVDNQQKQIDSLLSMAVILDSTQWNVNQNGTASMKATQTVDSLIVRKYAWFGSDTSHGHGGNDTLIVDPNGLLKNRK